MTGGDVGGNERRRGTGLERQLADEARQRQRHPGRRMRVRLIQFDAAGRDQRSQPEPRALALAGEGAEGGEVEIVLRRDLLQARIQHRLEPGAGQRIELDGGGKRERNRIAGRFVRALAGDRLAPPGKPHRRQSGIARAFRRLSDLVVERSQRAKRVARNRPRVERAKPLIAIVSAREGGAISAGLAERAVVQRTAPVHGVAISAAATRRFSDCMTL